MPGGGGDHTSHAAIVAARERERQIVQLYIRGANFVQIGAQLGIDQSTARKGFNRAVGRLPKADAEALRKLEAERIQDLRFRLWSEMAGRPDPDNPSRTIRPDPDLVVDLVDKAIKVGRHEAMIFGLDAPTKAQVVSSFTGKTVSDEELDIQLARLTDAERDTFMMLLAKMQGRWVEPPSSSIETTATTQIENEPKADD